MDQNPSEYELREFILKILETKGPKNALIKLKRFTTNIDKSLLPVQIKQLLETLEYASTNEENIEFLLNRILSAKGFKLPHEQYFLRGFPKSEFALYVDLYEGRLGDCLGKLAELLHAQEKLNLLLLIRIMSSTKKRILHAKHNYFETDLPQINYVDIHPYIREVSQDLSFNRSLLQSLPKEIFDRLPNKNTYNEFGIDQSATIHIRGGDALFNGAFPLPPISYYIKCIELIKPTKIILVCEPDKPNEYGRINPLPLKLESYLAGIGIPILKVSNLDLFNDAGILFYSKTVVSSTSLFSKMLPLYGTDCTSLYSPVSYSGKSWFDDKIMNWIECWNNFDHEKWTNDLNYRLSWVTQEFS